jgi:hypothetical protein
MAFESLDFVYLPSADVAADMRYFTDVLGGTLVFAVHGMGARVAMIALTDPAAGAAPRILLTDHLEDERPILIYRVADLARTMDDLEARGWRRQATLEIPHGPCCSFVAPGGQRIAIYERSRPQVEDSFSGRRDF